MSTKKLFDILPNELITNIVHKSNVVIEGITLDSRNVESGWAFIAKEGYKFDGHSFIDAAIGKGASVIFAEKLPDNLSESVVYIQYRQPRDFIGLLAHKFYNEPSRELFLIGVTGTNGKSSVATMVFQFLDRLGLKAGLISTIENKIGNEVQQASLTTPDPVSLNGFLRKMLNKGCEYGIMEVSSHALDQGRVSGLEYDVAIFTNITHDHLDYHQTFRNYLEAKKTLFDNLGNHATAIINTDDKNGKVMVQNTRAAILTYGLNHPCDIKGKILSDNIDGMLLDINGNKVDFTLSGRFNAYNLLAAYAVSKVIDIEEHKALVTLSGVSSAKGRFQKIKGKNTDVTAIIDYAHTPDALENVLTTINNVISKKSKIITVIGCGGNRDKAKRPLMANIATNMSDFVILTSDNPRNEDPEIILNEMEEGIDTEDTLSYLRITDRKQAIKTACHMARGSDVILIAGKGHENYQEIRGQRFDFDDLVIAREFLQ